MLGLIALWFRQVREAERESGEAVDKVSLPDKSKLFEALQRLPISFGMAMRVSVVVFVVVRWRECIIWSDGRRCGMKKTLTVQEFSVSIAARTRHTLFASLSPSANNFFPVPKVGGNLMGVFAPCESSPSDSEHTKPRFRFN